MIQCVSGKHKPNQIGQFGHMQFCCHTQVLLTSKVVKIDSKNNQFLYMHQRSV